MRSWGLKQSWNPSAGLTLHAARLGSYMGAGYSSPGPHACTTRGCFTRDGLPSPLFHFKSLSAYFIFSRPSPSRATIATGCCFQLFAILRSSAKRLCSDLYSPGTLGMLKRVQLGQSQWIVQWLLFCQIVSRKEWNLFYHNRTASL